MIGSFLNPIHQPPLPTYTHPRLGTRNACLQIEEITMKTPTLTGRGIEGQEANSSADDNIFLDEKILACRWDCSNRKLQTDRQNGCGPSFIKIGRLVRYRLSDVIG